MEFSFSFVAQEIFDAWLKTSQQKTTCKTRYDKNKINIICAIYRTVIYSNLNIPVGSYREEHEISVRSQDASHIMSGKKLPNKDVIAIRNSFNVERNMMKHIEVEIIPHLDTNKINALTAHLIHGVYRSKIPGHIQEDIRNHTQQKDLAYLLMRVIRAALDVSDQNVAVDENPTENRYDVQARLDKIEQQIRKITAVIEKRIEQSNQFETLLINVQDSATLTSRMKQLEKQIFEVTTCLQELQREYDRLRQMNTFAAPVSSNTILYSPSQEALFLSLEAAMAELEARIENAIFEDGELWSALYDANLPQNEKVAEFLLGLTDSYDCYEIYDILFDRYVHLLNPSQHKKLVDKAKSLFIPEIYKEWDTESACSLSTTLTENDLLKKHTTESQ